jgi:hypothetical protein
VTDAQPSAVEQHLLVDPCRGLARQGQDAAPTREEHGSSSLAQCGLAPVEIGQGSVLEPTPSLFGSATVNC